MGWTEGLIRVFYISLICFYFLLMTFRLSWWLWEACKFHFHQPVFKKGKIGRPKGQIKLEWIHEVECSFCMNCLDLSLASLKIRKVWISRFLRSVLKFIYSEKATTFCEIFALLLPETTKDKSKVKISQNCVPSQNIWTLK